MIFLIDFVKFKFLVKISHDFLNQKANLGVARVLKLKRSTFLFWVWQVCLMACLPFFLSACQTLPNHPHLVEDPPVALPRSAPSTNPNGFNLPNLPSMIPAPKGVDPSQFSGYYPLFTGADAFLARNVLIETAKNRIDAQYYIWHNDKTGQFILKKLWEAAERGVKVRLLLDDFNINAEFDRLLHKLALHKNVSVRLMNPVPYRSLRTMNYLTHPKILNHRMHNKSLTVDDRFSIIGGRNIGDEYLDYDPVVFADLDLLLVGKVVNEVGQSFEDYWRSALAFDIQTLAPKSPLTKSPADQTFLASLTKLHPFEKLLQQKYEDLLKRSPFSRFLQKYNLFSNSLMDQKVLDAAATNAKIMQKVQDFHQDSSQIFSDVFYWTKIDFFADRVQKLSGSQNLQDFLLPQLRKAFGKPKQELTLVCSYFVPTQKGVEALEALAKSGVKVKILTNSFRATDVTVVHAGYAKWRKRLLQAGIRLYELKAMVQEGHRKNQLWRTQSHSSSSLHAKVFALDQSKIFVGSYNIDPRSANLNTELGVMIEDNDFAKSLHDILNDILLYDAYEVILTPEGRLNWQTYEQDRWVVHEEEPDMNWFNQAWTDGVGKLAVDWLL